MEIITRAVVLEENKLNIKEIEYLGYNFNTPVVMAIDGSTTCTGIAFVTKETGQLVGTMALIRNKETETQVRYKIAYKKIIRDILDKYEIRHIYYEEPFIGYAEAAKALFLLRSSIEEIIVEYEPKYDYVEYKEVNNKRWKSILLGEGNCPNNSELEKAAIKKIVCDSLPFMDKVTQDEIDATGLGFVATTRLREGNDESLESIKKLTKFVYNVEFIGADNKEEMLDQLLENIDSYKIPNTVIDNGIKIVDIPGSGLFDNYVYKNMMGIDKILVLGFSSKHHANMIVRHKVGYLIQGNEKVYAIVWRKSRLKVNAK